MIKAAITLLGISWFKNLTFLHSPVKGMHIITNIRSLMAKLIIRMLVVERINGLKATTGSDNKNSGSDGKNMEEKEEDKRKLCYQ